MTHKIYNTNIIRNVDYETGEVKNESVIQKGIYIKTNEPYFLTYARELTTLYNIPGNHTFKVLYKLIELMQIDKNTVSLSLADKKEIMQSLEISRSTFIRAMNDLQTAGIIDGKDGKYTISIKNFWKGSSKERDRLLALNSKVIIVPDEQ